jgi:hypothetical protein
VMNSERGDARTAGVGPSLFLRPGTKLLENLGLRGGSPRASRSPFVLGLMRSERTGAARSDNGWASLATGNSGLIGLYALARDVERRRNGARKLNNIVTVNLGDADDHEVAVELVGTIAIRSERGEHL